MKAELIEVINVANRLGEGVLWDAESGSVWWTDILSRKLYAYRLSDAHLTEWETPEELACFALVQGQDDCILAGFASGFAYFELSSARVDWICKVEEQNSLSRLNDGRVDRQGRFWVGTMAPDAKSPDSLGALYSLDCDHKLRKHISGIEISNSLCWSPDSHTVYHCDTPRHVIQSYAFDSMAGSLGGATDFVVTEEHCFPDGSTIDADGYLLNAQWGGSKIVRYSPDGKVDSALMMPVSQPTCVAIGGAENNLLFVTSAKEVLERDEPDAGSLFIYKTDLTGLPETRYFSEVLTGK